MNAERWEALVHRHAALAVERQLALADRLGDFEWEVDFDAGTFSAGNEGQAPAMLFGMQVIATHLDSTNHWCWAWADVPEATRTFPAAVTRAARALRALGVVEELDLLTTPVLELDEDARVRLALVAAGASKALAFFRVPVPGGSVYVLLEGEVEEPALHVVHHVAERFPKVLEHVSMVDERVGFVHYLRSHGLRVREEPGAVVGLGPAGERLRARFDPSSRFVGVDLDLLA